MNETHYRRASAADLEALAADGTGEYAALAAYGAVRVGTSGGDAILHVQGGDRDGLPGAFEAAALAEMHPSVRRNVARARWTPTSDTDPGYGPVADIPSGAVVLETSLAPHSFY